MKIDVREQSVSVIPQYATIPIAFEVTSVLDTEQDKDGMFELKGVASIIRTSRITTPSTGKVLVTGPGGSTSQIGESLRRF